MKINRRNFIAGVTSLGIGAAAGTALSPMPWKITDDLSIWTQNWNNRFIRTPVPEDGAATYVNSACTLCPGGCGITVRKIDERAVKIEGLKQHPVNDGGVCMLGISGLQLLYGKSRIKSPLLRTAKGWKKISWDEGIKIVAEKLNKIREDGESTQLACISDSDRGTVAHLLGRFMTAFGSPNYFRVPSYQDVYELTLKKAQGKHAYPGFDLENADYVLSFGSGLIDGWGSPVRMFRANAKWRAAKNTVVQIEPRMSRTAAKASQWIPIIPGTEADLALGVAHIIITKKLYNKDFIKHSVDGFAAFQKSIGSDDVYGPAKTAQITGIAADRIEKIANDFAHAAKPIALFGKGQGRSPGSLRESMAIYALNVLVGNINREGGLWAMPEMDYIHWPAPSMDPIAQKGMKTSRIDGAGQGDLADTRYLLNRLPQIINAKKESSGIKVLFVNGANPSYTMQDAAAFEKALEEIPFVVSFSTYMDETTQKASLILPNHSHLERFEDVPFAAGLQMPIISLTQPVVDPQYNTRHTGDVIIALAKEMGGNLKASFTWKDYVSCLEETMGDKWETLKGKGFWVDKTFNKASLSGKIELSAVTNSLKQGVKIEGDYELTLVPFDTIRLANGSIGSPPFVLKTVPDTVLRDKSFACVEVNSQTARRLGLRNGRLAKLQTPITAVNVEVIVSEGVMPGVIAIARGLGHEIDDNTFDNFLANKGVNFNELISPVEDASTGLDAAFAVKAKLEKA